MSEWTVSPAAYDFLQRVRFKAKLEGVDPDQALIDMHGLLCEEAVLYARLLEIINDEAKEISNYIHSKVMLDG